MSQDNGQLTEYEHRFRAMGTDMLVIVATDGAAGQAEAAFNRVSDLFADQEARFSRFIQDSELTRLNKDGGSDRPSDAMWDVLRRAKDWWEWTGGVFDPTIIGGLEAAGYDRSFELIMSGAGAPAARSTVTFADVELQEQAGARCVVLRNGARVDLGGIVKGWTVDRAAELLTGFRGFLVDAGGDIRAAGESTDGFGWAVALEDPSSMGSDQWGVWLTDSAVATSGTYRRQWVNSGGAKAHHLIDPRTGQPSWTDAIAVTVTGPTCEASEVIAKTALLAGWKNALDVVARYPQTEALVFGEDGAWRCSPGWTMSPVSPMGVMR